MRLRGRGAQQREEEKKTEGGFPSDWPATEDDWRQLVTWTLWLTGSGTC